MRTLFALFALLLIAPAIAQNTVTLGASVTTGNGTLTTDVTWSTSPPLTVGTPCTATGSAQWAGMKAGSGTQSITIATSGTLSLALTCRFAGDSIVTFTWTNATQNTDATPYTNPKAVRLMYTFTPLGPTAAWACGADGVVCVDVPDAVGSRPTMRTVTGISATGSMSAVARHVNQTDGMSAPSNTAMKLFQGNVDVTQSVSLTVNPLPGAPSNFETT